ncbi:MAG: hypothetical protein J3K34DRAFT_40770 [Monoraphidium minutum]|nr:MAG: hypothetical protein J3K34DRAFT_40770 [Monoraphidium minutum]
MASAASRRRWLRPGPVALCRRLGRSALLLVVSVLAAAVAAAAAAGAPQLGRDELLRSRGPLTRAFPYAGAGASARRLPPEEAAAKLDALLKAPRVPLPERLSARHAAAARPPVGAEEALAMRMRGAEVEAGLPERRSPEAAQRDEALISQHMGPLRRQVAAQLAARATAGPEQQPGAPPALTQQPGALVSGAAGAAPIEVQVYFHVLTHGGKGAVPQPIIDEQIEILNAAYAPFFAFRLVQAQLVAVGSDIFYGALDLYYTEYFISFVAALHEGGRTVLNVFTADLVTSTGGVFGVASFPTACYALGCKNDNVLIDFDTLPKGGLHKYNEGGTLVHEVGHWMGLLHTFAGESCSYDNKGDRIDDTPTEKEPAFVCEERDSCPDLPGSDPIHNYMDYTDDACKTHFTEGQFARMLAVWKTIRTRPFTSCRASTLPKHPQCDPWALSCINPLQCDHCGGLPCAFCPSHAWPADGACDGLGVGSRCQGGCAQGYVPAPVPGGPPLPPAAYCGSDGFWQIWDGGCVKESIQLPRGLSTTGQAPYTLHLRAAPHAAARAACRAGGGELATLPNGNDGAMVSFLLEPWSAWIGLATINGQPSTNPSDWAWLTTGLRPAYYGYSNWGGSGYVPQQPDNLGGREGRAALLQYEEKNCRWADAPASQAEPYVCQSLGDCLWSDLPPAPKGSAWPPQECDGVKDGGSCAAPCAAGLLPGPDGPPVAACAGGAWAVRGYCGAKACSADDLPGAPENSAWLPFQCEGRTSNSPSPCVAACALGHMPGPGGAPSSLCAHGRWTPVNGSCAAAACAVVIEPADPAFAGGEASPISLAEVQLYSKPGGRIKRADLTPGLSASTRDGGVARCFDGKKTACTSKGPSPSLVVAYPCSKQLSKVVIKNAASKNSAALGRITSYRLRLFSRGAEPANVTLAFGDIGPKAQYTAQRAKGGAWGWK